MSLSDKDADILRMYGFTIREIQEYQTATDPAGNPQPLIDLNSDVWRETILTRQTLLGQIAKQYTKDTGKKISRLRRDAIINGYYSTNIKSSPWDFLKLEYQPRKVVDFTNNSIEQARKDARKRISAWKHKWVK
jgi:hypothetical protein